MPISYPIEVRLVHSTYTYTADFDLHPESEQNKQAWYVLLVSDSWNVA